MPSGNPNIKPGPGRPKGQKSGYVDAKQTMIDAGFNPIDEAIKRYRNPLLKESTHNLMLQILEKKWSPDLKAVEVTGKDGEQLIAPQIIRMSTNPIKDPNVTE